MASDTEHRAEKCSRQDDLVDRISNLPDEILVNILSLLSFSEALATSVLSSRWIHLWKSAVSVLDFDGLKLLDMGPHFLPEVEPPDWYILDDDVPISLPRKPSIMEEKRLRYMNSVNRVLRHIYVLQIKKFRVSFNLKDESNSKGGIDRWIEFALSKRVEYLDLSFGVMSYDIDYPDLGDYSLSGGCYNYIKTPIGLSNIKHLRSLRLSYVDVEEEIVEYIIFNCPLLEELVVSNAESLRNLRVLGSPSSPLALKYLKVTSCYCLSSMEIDHAPSLSHLVHHGRWTEVHVDNCASLVDVDISFIDRIELPAAAFTCLSAYAGQLESLSLKLDHLNIEFPDMDELSSLEKLKMELFGAKSDNSILGLVPLINACPCLHTLRVELRVESNRDESEYGDLFAEAVEKVCRESIKVVEIEDFNGYDLDNEFVEYVLEYFTGLEKIVIERQVWQSKYYQPEGEFMKNFKQNLEEVTNRALELKSLAPPGLEFVIL